MIDETEMKRRVQHHYSMLLDHHGENDAIGWTTEDGRKMALGKMTDRQLHNAMAFFVSRARRSADLVETLEKHLEENPDDHGRAGFEENIGEHLDAIIHNRLIHHAMYEQQTLRMAARERGEKAGPLTLPEKITKMRKTKRETLGLEGHL